MFMPRIVNETAADRERVNVTCKGCGNEFTMTRRDIQERVAMARQATGVEEFKCLDCLDI